MRNGTSRILTQKSGETGKCKLEFQDGKQPYNKSLDYPFHEDSGSTISGRIRVEDCVSLAATGFEPGQYVHVTQIIEGERVPYSPVPNKKISLSSDLTNIFIGHAGQYELVMSHPSMVGKVKVRLDKDCTVDYAAWLLAVK